MGKRSTLLIACGALFISYGIGYALCPYKCRDCTYMLDSDGNQYMWFDMNGMATTQCKTANAKGIVITPTPDNGSCTVPNVAVPLMRYKAKNCTDPCPGQGGAGIPKELQKCVQDGATFMQVNQFTCVGSS
jgi:hypothetical protein